MKRTKTGLKISNGVIKLSFRNDDVTVKAIEKRLGDMWPAARKITRWILNDTAKKARSLLFQQAKKTYTIKTSTFNKTTTLKKATKAHLVAVISVTGKANRLKGFTVTPATLKEGTARPDVYKAKVVRANSPKPLIGKGSKAFLTVFKKGGVGLVEREGKERYPIKSLYSLSDPQMIGSKIRVYKIVKPEIHGILEKELERQIGRVLRGEVR
nr:MAG TPA: minor tail protein Z [Caudoviricetes sp.]DAP64031.1 MAG TPA: minor tail protein Z [Caudoviricetes sp.]